MKSRIFLSPPHMGGDELRLIQQAFDSNYIAPLGPMVDAFEKEFAKRVGIPYAVALSSGTAAMHLALDLLDVNPHSAWRKGQGSRGQRVGDLRSAEARDLRSDVRERHSGELTPELNLNFFPGAPQTCHSLQLPLKFDKTVINGGAYEAKAN